MSIERDGWPNPGQRGVQVQPATPVVPVQPVQPVEPVQAVQAVQPVAVVPAQRVTSIRRFAPDALIAALVGLVLTVVGLIAIVRAGIDEPVEQPVVEVLGFAHTAWLGMIELVIGLGLLLSGAAQSRSGAIFFGSVLGIGGFVGAVQEESFAESLALESSFAWLCVVAGVIVVVAALIVPRTVSRRDTVRSL
ncbi:MAG TPA: hypothetical protein VES40_08820 [Ilumatobacteraceae bacterium]|nr:hypothetical protein [Ilumatobacteraceae bacterium]